MSEVDRKLWIITHFVKHGYLENRKYRLKTCQPRPVKHKSKQVDQLLTETPKHHRHSHHHTSDSDSDVQTLIKKFRQDHTDQIGQAIRDKKIDTQLPKKNYFWEIKQ